MDGTERGYYSSIYRSAISVLLQEYYIKFCWHGKNLHYSGRLAVRPSVRPHEQLGPTGRIFMKFDI